MERRARPSLQPVPTHLRPLGHQGPKALRVSLEGTALQDSRGTQGPRGSRAHLDKQDLKALEVSRGHQGPRAAQSRDPWGHQEPKERRGIRDFQACRASLASKASLGKLAYRDQRA